MPIIACGLNHKTAPLAFREKLSVVPAQLSSSLQILARQQTVREVAILSTCNRTEFYLESDAHHKLLQWLSQTHQCSQDEVANCMYVHREAAAVRHIMRVASGLDSMVLGETQILGQMKNAFNQAKIEGTIGSHLQRLFQYVFSVTKEVRTNTGIGANPVSVAYCAVSLAKHMFADLSRTRVMVIGAGETIELAVRYLREQQVSQIYMANRTFTKAQRLAEKYHGHGITFSEISQYLPDVDIIIAATSSPIPILGKGTVERVMKSRHGRPVLMVDLAVPRDIEPEVADLQDIHLYCIDDLQQLIENNVNDRKDAALEAEKIIELQTDHYMRWLRSLDAVKTIRSFRDKIEGMRDCEIGNAMQQLRQGVSIEQVLCHMARNLTNKFMHIPTVQMREAGYDRDLQVLALVRQLFELET